MEKSNPLSLFIAMCLLITFTSCSFLGGGPEKKPQEADAEAAFGLDDLDSEEVVEEGEEGEESEEDLFASEDGAEEGDEEDLFAEEGEQDLGGDEGEEDLFTEGEEGMDLGDDAKEATISSDSRPAVDGSGRYRVKQGDTLMWIAYKIYGDYSMWRNLANANGGSQNISVGMTLNYEPPATPFMVQKNGNPYLINRGDTLGTISNNVYQTSSKWREIWNNNRDMIKDPNLIFAGFTLYYIPQSELMASLH